MPEPIPDPATGRALASVGGSLYRVHRWVDGQPGGQNWVDGPSAAVEAAELLASIHAAGSATSGPVPRVGWAAGRWGAELGELAGRVRDVPDRVTIVDSHRDLDPKNAIRRADGILAALDGDAAGPVGVPMEVVSVALDWSGGDPSSFADAVRAYTRLSGTTVPDRPWVFAGWVATTLGDLHRLAGRIDELVAALRCAALAGR